MGENQPFPPIISGGILGGTFSSNNRGLRGNPPWKGNAWGGLGGRRILRIINSFSSSSPLFSPLFPPPFSFLFPSPFPLPISSWPTSEGGQALVGAAAFQKANTASGSSRLASASCQHKTPRPRTCCPRGGGWRVSSQYSKTVNLASLAGSSLQSSAATNYSPRTH